MRISEKAGGRGRSALSLSRSPSLPLSLSLSLSSLDPRTPRQRAGLTSGTGARHGRRGGECRRGRGGQGRRTDFLGERRRGARSEAGALTAERPHASGGGRLGIRGARLAERAPREGVCAGVGWCAWVPRPRRQGEGGEGESISELRERQGERRPGLSRPSLTFFSLPSCCFYPPMSRAALPPALSRPPLAPPGRRAAVLRPPAALSGGGLVAPRRPGQDEEPSAQPPPTPPASFKAPPPPLRPASQPLPSASRPLKINLDLLLVSWEKACVGERGGPGEGETGACWDTRPERRPRVYPFAVSCWARRVPALWRPATHTHVRRVGQSCKPGLRG